MEIFKRRYLCFLSFLFLLSSFLATFMIGTVKIIAVGTLFACAIIFTIVLIRFKRAFHIFVAVISLALCGLALLNSFLFISLPRYRSAEYAGSSIVRMKVLSLEYESSDSCEYLVRVEQIGDEADNIKGYLSCDFYADLTYGDVVVANAEIEPIDYSAKEDVHLWLTVASPEFAVYQKGGEADAFSFDLILEMCNKMRSAFGEYTDALFGEEVGGFVKGLMINDRSDLSYETVADFRRSGTSHILAVSGLHVSLLLGALELLLRRFGTPKKARCITVAIFAVFFLALTNFSASAVRSVFMLMAVYLSFMISEENDSLTALFVSVALIVLLSPISVYDLGMWMSFFATLGIITVYPILEWALPYPRHKNKALRMLLRIAIATLKGALITVVANFFLLPVIWYFFGEISISAIPCNILLSPIISLLMPLCAISLCVGAIPFVGDIAVMCVKLICGITLDIVSFFADVRFALVSLRYPFVTVLVVLFTAAMVILLTVRIKHKLFVCLPMALFPIIFAVCVTVFNLTSAPTVEYISRNDQDFIIVSEGSVSSVCDISNAGSSAYWFLNNNMYPYSVEIENYIITHCHERHAEMLDRILQDTVIRKIYIPADSNTEYALEILYTAEKHGVRAEIFYADISSIELTPSISVTPIYTREEEGEHLSVALSFFGESESLLYSDAYESDISADSLKECQYLLFGSHGNKPSASKTLSSSDAKIIFSTSKRKENSRLDLGGNAYYILKEDNGVARIALVLH